MRVALLVCFVASISACGGSSLAPSAVSSGAAMSIAGTWDGTIVSSNNATAQFRMVLTQSGSAQVFGHGGRRYRVYGNGERGREATASTITWTSDGR